jgi:hypothetical protein
VTCVHCATRAGPPSRLCSSLLLPLLAWLLLLLARLRAAGRHRTRRGTTPWMRSVSVCKRAGTARWAHASCSRRPPAVFLVAAAAAAAGAPTAVHSCWRTAHAACRTAWAQGSLCAAPQHHQHAPLWHQTMAPPPPAQHAACVRARWFGAADGSSSSSSSQSPGHTCEWPGSPAACCGVGAVQA